MAVEKQLLNESHRPLSSTTAVGQSSSYHHQSLKRTTAFLLLVIYAGRTILFGPSLIFINISLDEEVAETTLSLAQPTPLPQQQQQQQQQASSRLLTNDFTPTWKRQHQQHNHSSTTSTSSNGSTTFRRAAASRPKLSHKNPSRGNNNRKARFTTIIRQSSTTTVTGATNNPTSTTVNASGIKHEEVSTTTLRFLFGIISTHSSAERSRRSAIRSTYLSHYNDWAFDTTPPRNRNNSSLGAEGGRLLPEKNYQICNLKEFQHRWSTLPHDQVECPFVYAFVLAGYPPVDARQQQQKYYPTQLFWKDNVTSSAEMIMAEPQFPLSDPKESATYQDMVYLKIRENMNDGKVPTWYQYGAAMVLEDQNQQQQQQQLPPSPPARRMFDFIGKLDSDTLVFPPYFFDWVNQARPSLSTPMVVRRDEDSSSQSLQQLQQPRLYIGHLVSREVSVAYSASCAPMTAPLYALGEMELLSTSLAQHISMELTTVDKQHHWVAGLEDVTLGNLIYHDYSYSVVDGNNTPIPKRIPPIPVQAIEINAKAYIHPLKRPVWFIKAYERLLREEGYRLAVQQEESSHTLTREDYLARIWNPGRHKAALAALKQRSVRVSLS
jgi:hypothetical protein